jgi:hypothetical protein
MLEERKATNNPDNDETGIQTHSTVENLRELTAASKQLFEAGKQMTNNLTELSNRVEHVTSVGSNILKNPLFLAGAAVFVGVLFVAFSRRT